MTYLLENINTTIAKIAECMARDPKRAERLLGDVKKWSAEAEREAYARGKVAGLKEAAEQLALRQRLLQSQTVALNIQEADNIYSLCIDAIRALIPEN